MDLQEEALITNQLHEDMLQRPLYKELQNLERSVVKELSEHVNTPMRQSLESPMQPFAFPDPTNFLFNQYLVDNAGQPHHYKPMTDDLSPRTRFFLQNKHAPQYELETQE